MANLHDLPLGALPDILLNDAPRLPTQALPAPGRWGDGGRLPERIGKYKVLSRIGEGATSEVFLAEDPFHARRVAIKRARPPSALSAEDERYHQCFFASEAALVGQLQHPNVVQIFDAVPDAMQPYLVMEHVAGGTLRPHCRPDALLPLEQIVELGFKCAMALAYVSKKGLVHRDVKPANILVVRDGDTIRDIKLSDFGSAYHLTSDRTQVFRVGSLAYMSPEQLEGSVLDARADMYALGAVLYHLIAGRPPFDAPTPVALMNQIYHAEPKPLVQLRHDVPRRMSELIAALLSKRLEDRPADWDAFARDWSELVTHAEVPAGSREQVRDSERFTLLRKLDFFSSFGDVELWEVVHRAQWQRHPDGAALYRVGSDTRSFHIIASGSVHVYRDGARVAQLGAGTSVGEMAYLAPSPDLRVHSADVIVARTSTTISFTPEQMETFSPSTRHLFDRAFIRVLVRRLHAAHEALHHPRRIL